MKRQFTATIENRGKWYICHIEEVPGVNTQGRTEKEVLENLEDALRLMLDFRKEQITEVYS